MADIEEEILLLANLFLLLVLKRKIFRKRQDSFKFLADFFPTVRLFVFVFEILTITVVNALMPRNYVQCQPCLKQISVAFNEHSGFMAEKR